MCGTLQCETTAKFPLFGGSQIINLKTKSFPNGTTISCKAANIDLGPDIPDPGLVEDGSPCYDLDKDTAGVCLAQKCIDIKTFPFKHCPRGLNGVECSGKGVCDCYLNFAQFNYKILYVI
ncbi:hypothetical protein ACJMK2_005341 [Sinanodonta woodiana]|uniref:Uncharacterized protein n=1 Tax=Sinanodonta woodiana TaxID=1069815 RepID=A0ABD3VT81_SINWO